MIQTTADVVRGDLVQVMVELFGRARLLAGRREVPVEVPVVCGIGKLASVLADSVPTLMGEVVREDNVGLVESYVFNLNGIRFLGDEFVELEQGDRILLFSSQAGG